MSSTLAISRREATWQTKTLDYLELTKPRIASMVLVVVCTSGYLASGGQPSIVTLLNAVVGTFLVAASAATFNQWSERHTDTLMPRTADRPIAAGRVPSWEAIGFGTVLLGGGIFYLWWMVNAAAMLWAVATWIGYVAVYTPLKKRTAWNTLVGAVGGAMPVLIGWFACADGFDAWSIWPLSLFLVLLLWQLPHFMAIAWMYRSQYERAGLQMLTVTDASGKQAGWLGIFAAALLLPASLLPICWNLHTGTMIYAVLAISLGAIQLFFAARFARSRNEQSARCLLRMSLIYLPLLLASLVSTAFI